jgi:hypothetical protein
MSWTLQSSNSASGNTPLFSNATGERLLRTINNQLSTSLDYGVTWSTPVSVGAMVQTLIVSADSTLQYVVATGTGPGGGGFAVQIYRSTDFGNTFSVLSNSPTLGWSSISSDSTGQYLVAGASSSQISYYSVDYGNSWNQCSGIDAGYIVLQFVSSSNGKYVVAASGVPGPPSIIQDTYVSSDYGATFTKNTRFTTGSYAVGQLAMDSTGQYVIVSIRNGDSPGVYRSTDYGVSWSITSAPSGRTYGGTSSDSTGQYLLAGDITNKQLYLSQDYGSSWTLQTTPNSNTGTIPLAVKISSNGSSYYFSVTGVGIYLRTGTPVAQVPCFKEGSKILTDKGYVEVQHLRKGDLVKTMLHSYVPINMIGYREIDHIATEDRIKNQLYKYTQALYPEVFEDLVLTGCHSILVEEFKDQSQIDKTLEINGQLYITDNKYRVPACADDRATVYETPGKYTIYHLALDNEDYYMNYGIYANGILVETCSKRYLKELSNMQLIE